MIKYTVEDYERLPHFDITGLLWELINGVFQMSPLPTSVHQKISGNIFFELRKYIKENKKSCEIYAPLDVRLDKDNVVQPDILVVCDKDKIFNGRCNGIPDLVIEILSPSTKQNDLPGGSKFKLYEQHKLKEYWIVDSLDENNITLTQFVLENNTLTQEHVFTKKDKFQSFLFPELEIDLSDVFALD